MRDKGDTGERGPRGDIGSVGPAGVRGERGTQGLDSLKELRKLATIIVALIVAFFLIVMISQHKASIDGCNRGKVNSTFSAKGWRAAQVARQEAFTANHKLGDLKAAQTYDQVASLFEKRAHIDCGKAYPFLGL